MGLSARASLSAARGLHCCLLTLALLAAGCGSGDSDEDAAGRILQRAVAADAQYGARFTVRGSAVEAGSKRPIAGYGQIERDEKRGRIVDSAGGLRLEFVTDAPFLLIPADDLFTSAQSLPPGKEWVKINMNAVADAPRLDALDRIERLGPTQIVTLLSRLDPEIEGAGRETVAGVQTTRYRVGVEVGELVDEILETAGAAVSDSDRDEDASFVLWVDGRHLVRRARVRLQIGDTTLVLTTQVTAYASHVRVKVPRADAIEDKTGEFVEFARRARAQREEQE